MPTALEHAAATWKGQKVKGGGGLIAKLDPRVRIMAAVGIAAVVVLAQGLGTMVLGLGLAILAGIMAQLALKPTIKRVLAMEGFILFMILMLPFTTPGTVILTIGPLVGTEEGVAKAIAIFLKANAVVLLVLALVGTMESATLGHALFRLKVPAGLVHILLFTSRYLEVIGREYRRMRAAMRARAFRPRSNLHTWRSIGYLVGMLLIRSVDRAQRILAAMKCRGYTGTLHVIDDLALDRTDIAFLMVAIVAMAGLAGLDLAAPGWGGQ